MICKFSGLCFICNDRISAGAECGYDGETKRIFHYACQENPEPTKEQAGLADRLGYKAYSWEELLRGMSRGNHRGPTGGTKPEAS